MNIAYLRYNYPTELDYCNASASTLGADVRVPIINSLLKLGHHVSIYSYVPPRDQELIKTGKGQNFDYSRFRSIEVKQGPIDEDIAIIEQAAPVTIIADKKGRPLMDYVAEALRGYKGKVIWYHHGMMKCQQQLLWNAAAKDPTVSPVNLRNIFSEMGTKKSQFVAWTHTPNVKELVAKNKGLGGIPIITTPIGYDPDFEPQREPVEEANFDFMYVGANKENRQEKLMSFLYDIPYTVNIIGKGFPNKQVKNITFNEQVKGHAKVYDLYRHAYASLIVGNPEFERSGNQTTRFTQPINCGCITFGDAAYKGIAGTVGTPQTVKDRLALVRRFTQIMDSGEQSQIVKTQQHGLLQWVEILDRMLMKVESL